MKKFLILSLLFLSSLARAAKNDIVISQWMEPGTQGTKMGYMGMRDGKMSYWFLTTIHIAGGTYPGFTPLKTDTKYVPDGVVTYTSQIHLGNTNNVSFDGTGLPGVTYGFVYSGTGTVYDPGAGNNINDSLMGWDYGTKASVIFNGDPSPRVFYNGTPQSTVYWGLYVNQFKMGRPGQVYAGTFQYNPSKLNLAVGMEFDNADLTNDTLSTMSSIRIAGHSIYALRIKHWRVRGMSIHSGDEGIAAYIEGNYQIEDVFRDSSRGYISRVLIATLAGLPFDQSCWIKNCRDVNSFKYGTVDARVQADQLCDTGTYRITGGNFTFMNNTSGNKLDDNYVSNAVVAGGMQELNGKKDTIFILNNLAFNAYTGSGQAGGSSLLKDNSGGGAVIIKSNNSDLAPGVALPAGLLDVNWYALPGTYLATGNIGAYPPALPSPGPCGACNTVNGWKYANKKP